jgi:hypothetical protein
MSCVRTSDRPAPCEQFLKFVRAIAGDGHQLVEQSHVPADPPVLHRLPQLRRCVAESCRLGDEGTRFA